MNSFKKFDEDKLSARKYFFSLTKKGKIDNDGKISDGHISIEDYLLCEKIWNKFEMKNKGGYHDHYLKKDILLLADIFQRFISTCLKYYELDPCHDFSSPKLSWDAMLKKTKIELEKISDIDKYLFIGKGTRGGVSYIAKRYAKVNNKYMNNYDVEKPSTFITYLDKKNLYGWSMSKYLPYEKFECLESIDEFDVMSINEKNEIGYVFEVDLKYPKNYINYRMIYPLASEKRAVSSDMLSTYYKNIANKYDIKVGDVKKLIPNLGNKTKHAPHYRNLQL